jgi:hypothetical protein
MITGQFPKPEPDPEAPIYAARLRYNITVGRATLIAYAALGGVTLALCFTAVALGTYTKAGSRAREPSVFPILDFCTRTEVFREADGKPVTKNEFRGLAEFDDGNLVREATTMRITLAEAIVPSSRDILAASMAQRHSV